MSISRKRQREQQEYDRRMEELNKQFSEADSFEIPVENAADAEREIRIAKINAQRKKARKEDKKYLALDSYINDEDHFMNLNNADKYFYANNPNEFVRLRLPPSVKTARVDEKSTIENVSTLPDCIDTVIYQGNVSPEIVQNTSLTVKKANFGKNLSTEAVSKLSSGIHTVGIFSQTPCDSIRSLPSTVSNVELHRDVTVKQLESMPSTIENAYVVSPDVNRYVRAKCKNKNITLFVHEEELSWRAPDYLQERYGRTEKPFSYLKTPSVKGKENKKPVVSTPRVNKSQVKKKPVSSTPFAQPYKKRAPGNW